MQIKNFRWQWALAAPIALSMLGATLSGPVLAQTGRQKYEKKQAVREQKQDIKGAQEHARLRAKNAWREQRQDLRGAAERARYESKYHHMPGHKLTHHHTKRHHTDRDHDHDVH